MNGEFRCNQCFARLRGRLPRLAAASVFACGFTNGSAPIFIGALKLSRF
ncbi:hypothetical protein APY04_1842 [Hyphomicrobium sulfonivorans]|uniref:Uncharacterized protein n=1 Tax=Hyphomicrobium sulfonivorans TaxID=121290 RepID=A0A109BGL7_HYPSL|nr:hypothetical protein APY04_1842 [Hyphomicrobium sulfonivorans]